MMPETPGQWLWFIFYTVGALGGWWVAVIWGAELIRIFQEIRARRAR